MEKLVDGKHLTDCAVFTAGGEELSQQVEITPLLLSGPELTVGLSQEDLHISSECNRL